MVPCCWHRKLRISSAAVTTTTWLCASLPLGNPRVRTCSRSLHGPTFRRHSTPAALAPHFISAQHSCPVMWRKNSSNKTSPVTQFSLSVLHSGKILGPVIPFTRPWQNTTYAVFFYLHNLISVLLAVTTLATSDITRNWYSRRGGVCPRPKHRPLYSHHFAYDIHSTTHAFRWTKSAHGADKKHDENASDASIKHSIFVTTCSSCWTTLISLQLTLLGHQRAATYPKNIQNKSSRQSRLKMSKLLQCLHSTERNFYPDPQAGSFMKTSRSVVFRICFSLRLLLDNPHQC